MGLNLGSIEVLIYDLDGTLYEDTHHFELYAREIQSHLPSELHAAFWADYLAVEAGAHPALRVGTFYDVRHDLVLKTRAGIVTQALHWDGSEAPPLLVRELYKGPVEPDHDQVMNVGDLWWVPSAISAHYGGEAAKRGEAFLKIREVMSDPAFEIRPIPGLLEAITAVRGRAVQVLATNSPQPDSEAILKKVGLLGRLDRMFFRSNKPAGLKSIIATLSQEFGVPCSAILSVGDNLINEIAPARALGCQTVFLDPHGLGDDSDADLHLRSMKEFLPVLHQIARR